MFSLICVISSLLLGVSAEEHGYHHLDRFRRNAPQEPLTRDLFFERCRTPLTYLPDFQRPTATVCENWWNTFMEIIECVDGCKPQTDGMYASLVNSIAPKLSRNTVTFWTSGKKNDVARRAKTIANMYGGYTLEETRLGYIFNDVWWCCAKNGELMTSCASCKNENDPFFWRDASRAYARYALGETYVLLDGTSSDQPYYEGSYFRQYEVPYLDRSAVDSLTIHLTYDSKSKHKAVTCEKDGDELINESLQNLQNELAPVPVICVEGKYTDVECGTSQKSARSVGEVIDDCRWPSRYYIENGAMGLQPRTLMYGIIAVTISKIMH